VTAVERLDEIEARLDLLDWPKTDDVRTLVAALRAALAIHAEHVAPLVRAKRSGQCLCAACNMARAITAALDPS